MCTGELHIRIPSWLESYYWTWYASGIHDSIFIQAAKRIGFSADEPARKCVGSIADSASRHHTSITTSGYTCISAFANKSKPRVGPMADTSATVPGNNVATQVSNRSSSEQDPTCQWSHMGFSRSCDWDVTPRRCAQCAWVCTSSTWSGDNTEQSKQ